MAKIAIGLMLSVACTMSMAQDESAFGLVFGATIRPDVCRSVGRMVVDPVKGMCIEDLNLNKLGNTAYTTTIRFGVGELPLWVGYSQVEVTIVDGKLEAMSVPTTGLRGDQFAVASLVKKFGEPQSRDKRSYRNTYGVAYEATSMQWKTRSLNISYFPVEGRIDEGRIYFSTDIGAREMGKKSQQIQVELEGKTPL